MVAFWDGGFRLCFSSLLGENDRHFDEIRSMLFYPTLKHTEALQYHFFSLKTGKQIRRSQYAAF